MRKLLFLALLLYDFISASRPNSYDYDDLGVDMSKRHHILDEKRREWRRKANMKSDIEHKEWDDRRRHDYENRYFDDLEKNFGADKGAGQDRSAGQDREINQARNMNEDRALAQERNMGQDRVLGQERSVGQERAMGLERARERENEINYRRRYDDIDKVNMPMGGGKSSEIGPMQASYTGDQEKKASFATSCDRPHERYEACFAGCASVSCDNPRDRLRPCYPFCEPGCVCVGGYVRDDRTHKCVLPDDCTKGLKGIPDLGDVT